MNKSPLPNLKSILIGTLLLIVTLLSISAKPTNRLAEIYPPLVLEKDIPQSFGTWKIDDKTIPILPNPDVQANLSKVYNQTLARTYINSDGKQVMLSLAYGEDQSNDDTQVHRPEFCYTAQGFSIIERKIEPIKYGNNTILVKRLFASQNTRLEPITYWIVIGNKTTLPGMERKLTQLRYGLTGYIPDGILVRVSSIDANEDDAYYLQDQFITSMLDSLTQVTRERLIGSPN